MVSSRRVSKRSADSASVTAQSEPAAKKGRAKATTDSTPSNGVKKTTAATVGIKDEPIAIDEPSTSTGIVRRGRRAATSVKVNYADNDVDDEEKVSNKKQNGKVKKEVSDDEESKPNTNGKAKVIKGKSAVKKSVAKKKSATVKKEENGETDKPKKKSGVQRTVVKKGRACVDSHCPVAASVHVLDEGDDIWDCMLNQTNIQFNNNKYYLIQLLEDDGGGVFSVWMRWGRVGATGQSSLKPCGSNLNQAKKIFSQKFADKTKNDWDDRHDFDKVPGKYDILHMDYSNAPEQTDQGTDQPDGGKKKKEPLVSKLEEAVKALVELICNVKIMEAAVVEMKYDANKAPLGKLTTEQIKAGYLALLEISNIVNTGSGKQSNKNLLQACNNFYTRIPHYFGMKVPPLISTAVEVKEKLDLLQALGDIQAAMTFLKDSSIDDGLHPADSHYTSLKCDIKTLDHDCQEFKLISQYVSQNHGKTHSSYTLSVEEVFECQKKSEQSSFMESVGNRVLLWHGSRLSNWAGILSQGLRIAPPEAPVTGYMFGKGLYFADMCSKSANYCMASCTNSTGLMTLCEVALGKSHELLQADYRADKMPTGCHSVKGVGSMAPQTQNAVTMDDGVVVPLGPAKEISGQNKSLLYNEFIVYNTAQARLRYLVKVKFNFKNSWI